MRNQEILQKHVVLLGLILLMSFGFLMYGNGMISLTHPDEVFYTQIAKEMIAHKSWMTAYIFDAPNFEKPILFYWLQRAAVQAFGPHSFVARFWPAFFGILGVCVTYGMSWILFGKKSLSFLSALILMTSFIYIALSRAILTDMVFSIWVVLAITCFAWAYYQRNFIDLSTLKDKTEEVNTAFSKGKKGHYTGFHNVFGKEKASKSLGLVLFWVFCALAVLTKGLLGLCFPLATVVLFLLYKKELSFVHTQAFWGGMILFILLAVPWHILMYKLYGQPFIDEYWHNVHVRRIFEAEHKRCDTWYFYLGVMFGGLMPWSLFLPPALVKISQTILRRTSDFDRYAFLCFWFLGVFLFVEPAHSKLASYIIPVFPALAIFVAAYIHLIWEEKFQVIPWGMMAAGLLMSAVLILAGIAAIFFAKENFEMIGNMQPIYVFAGFMAFLAVVFLFLIWQRKFNYLCAAHVGITITVLITLFLGKVYAEPWVSCRDIVNRFKALDHSDTVVLTSKFYVRGVKFYTNREVAVIDMGGTGFFSPHPIPFLNTEEKVRAFLDSQPFTFCIVKEGNVQDLERITQGHYTMQHLGEIGGKYILRIEKMSYRPAH